MDGWRVPLDERRGYIGGSNVRRAVRRRWRTCTLRHVTSWYGGRGRAEQKTPPQAPPRCVGSIQIKKGREREMVSPGRGVELEKGHRTSGGGLEKEVYWFFMSLTCS
jgi:hypothetical protein